MPQKFAGANTVTAPDEEPYLFVRGELPKMVASEEELEVLESLGQSSKVAITAMIVIPIVLGIFLKGILSKLWSMVATLQLINVLSIYAVSFPANVIIAQKAANEIINF